MIKIRFTLFALILVTLTNCSNDKDVYPLDKRYWDISDYDKVVRHLNYGYKSDETLPTLDNPNTRLIVEKLTDQQNFNIVLDDNELGLIHRNEVGEKFFRKWRDMNRIYDARDRRDQYVYDKEMLALWHFGLGLQIKYFNLGNEQIRERADDPNASRVRNNINSNINTLIRNFLIYLDEINIENAYTDEGKVKLAEGIDLYFTELITLYPDANYREMKKKAELMLHKSESARIQSSLNDLIELINSKEVRNE